MKEKHSDIRWALQNEAPDHSHGLLCGSFNDKFSRASTGASMVATKGRETKWPMALTHSFPKLLPTAGGKQQTKIPTQCPFLSQESCSWLAKPVCLGQKRKKYFFFGGTYGEQGEWHPPGDVCPLHLVQFYSFLWLLWKSRFHFSPYTLPDVICASNFM